jgi:hypothetical protein
MDPGVRRDDGVLGVLGLKALEFGQVAPVAFHEL